MACPLLDFQGTLCSGRKVHGSVPLFIYLLTCNSSWHHFTLWIYLGVRKLQATTGERAHRRSAPVPRFLQHVLEMPLLVQTDPANAKLHALLSMKSREFVASKSGKNEFQRGSKPVFVTKTLIVFESDSLLFRGSGLLATSPSRDLTWWDSLLSPSPAISSVGTLSSFFLL